MACLTNDSARAHHFSTQVTILVFVVGAVINYVYIDFRLTDNASILFRSTFDLLDCVMTVWGCLYGFLSGFARHVLIGFLTMDTILRVDKASVQDPTFRTLFDRGCTFAHF